MQYFRYQDSSVVQSWSFCFFICGWGKRCINGRIHSRWQNVHAGFYWSSIEGIKMCRIFFMRFPLCYSGTALARPREWIHWCFPLRRPPLKTAHPGGKKSTALAHGCGRWPQRAESSHWLRSRTAIWRICGPWSMFLFSVIECLLISCVCQLILVKLLIIFFLRVCFYGVITELNG